MCESIFGEYYELYLHILINATDAKDFKPLLTYDF